MVNTCGFVEAAKKDSVDTLLAGRRPQGRPGSTQAVVAVGCLAERYGKELADSLPEADAVLGFDDYPDIAAPLRSIVAGEQHQAHTPQDRRSCCRSRPSDARRQRRGRSRARGRRRPAGAGCARGPARAPCGAGSTAARWRR